MGLIWNSSSAGKVSCRDFLTQSDGDEYSNNIEELKNLIFDPTLVTTLIPKSFDEMMTCRWGRKRLSNVSLGGPSDFLQTRRSLNRKIDMAVAVFGGEAAEELHAYLKKDHDRLALLDIIVNETKDDNEKVIDQLSPALMLFIEKYAQGLVDQVRREPSDEVQNSFRSVAILFLFLGVCASSVFTVGRTVLCMSDDRLHRNNNSHTADMSNQYSMGAATGRGIGQVSIVVCFHGWRSERATRIFHSKKLWRGERALSERSWSVSCQRASFETFKSVEFLVL